MGELWKWEYKNTDPIADYVIWVSQNSIGAEREELCKKKFCLHHNFYRVSSANAKKLNYEHLLYMAHIYMVGGGHNNIYLFMASIKV